jgi:hypothetical protein
VSLGVAKDQRLSLNPSQISGACGRLMCCLRYEHDFYVQARKRFPKEGKILVTARGEEKVIANDIFRELVSLRNAEGEGRLVALAELRRELDRITGAEDEPTEPAIEIAPGPDDTLLDIETEPEDEIRVSYTSTTGEMPVQPSPQAAPDTPADGPDEQRARRRRGRRGGRRGRRGGERGSPPTGA